MIKIRNIDRRGSARHQEDHADPVAGFAVPAAVRRERSGKSSITDAVEWFYYDRVDHLSTQEIGRGGIPALKELALGQ